MEIKARVRGPGLLRERAEQLSGSPGELLVQEDTFFNVPNGRLKLRVEGAENGQLIFYEREDLAGPKSSHYLIARTPSPDTLRSVLAAALGVRGTVRKRRTLFLVDQTRIHLDDVEIDMLKFVNQATACTGNMTNATRTLATRASGTLRLSLYEFGYYDSALRTFVKFRKLGHATGRTSEDLDVHRLLTQRNPLLEFRPADDAGLQEFLEKTLKPHSREPVLVHQGGVAHPCTDIF